MTMAVSVAGAVESWLDASDDARLAFLAVHLSIAAGRVLEASAVMTTSASTVSLLTMATVILA